MGDSDFPLLFSIRASYSLPNSGMELKIHWVNLLHRIPNLSDTTNPSKTLFQRKIFGMQWETTHLDSSACPHWCLVKLCIVLFNLES